MIQINKSYLSCLGGINSLCADVVIDKRETITLRFSLSKEKTAGLCVGRGDAFVMALLPMAIHGRHEVVCEDPVSDRLQYQLNQDLIPALTLESDRKNRCFAHITAPLAIEKYKGACAVAAGFSDGPAFFRTLKRHGRSSLYPLTHIAVWNLEGKAGAEDFQKSCRQAAVLAREQGLETLFLSSNLGEVLDEKLDAVSVFREMACALALEPMLGMYLCSSDRYAPVFRYDAQNCAAYELLIVELAATESLRFYLSGPEETDIVSRDSREQIVVGEPYTEMVEESVRLCAQVLLHGKSQTMWFSVPKEYGRYLTEDRADAFVAALLTTAMREGTDIVCKTAVSRQMLYQVNQYLIPMLLSQEGGEYHAVTVRAEPADSLLECEGAACTGGTGGVDCMFTLLQDQKLPLGSRHKLTHLFLANDGAIEGDMPKETLRRMMDRAERKIVPELGLRMLGIDTNLSQILPEKFFKVVNFRHGAAILALQKLLGTGLISSGYRYFEPRADDAGIAYCDMLIAACLSTEYTVFHSTGAGFSRIQKLEQLSQFPLARHVLHPCIYVTPKINCGTCGKCLRTQVSLYALGELERFSDVFDVDKFKKKKTTILARQYAETWISNSPNCHVEEGLAQLEKKGDNLLLIKLLAVGIVIGRTVKRTYRRFCRSGLYNLFMKF